MKILVIRHGTTDWNDKNLAQGSTDNPLNERGKEQAKRMGKQLCGLGINKLYSSPLLRARQTSQIIAQELENEIPIQYTPALREQDFGIFEGVLRNDEQYQIEKHQYFKRFKNGESFLNVAARVYPFLDELIATSNDQDVILLSCHGGICRMIASYFEDLDNDAFASYYVKNCEVKSFEIKKMQKR